MMPLDMGLYERVKEGWGRASDDLAGTDAFWGRSALGLSLFRDLRRVLTAEHVRGRLLDAGAGKLPYRHVVEPLCAAYVSMDVRKTHPDLDVVGDLQAIPLPDASFETVLCVEVLEHVPSLEQALREISRILRPGGKLILSVPHLFYLHNEPYDFYRYTKYGLRVLLERAGFRIVLLEPSAGMFSFLQGLLATAVVGLTYKVPLLWPVVFPAIRLASRTAVWLDAHTDGRKLFALRYIAVARTLS